MAASGYTIRVEGYKQCIHSLRKIESSVDRKVVRDGLKKAADPVARDAQQRISKYQGASLKTIGPRVVTNGVFVTQRARKVTGLRGDFGALQMRKGFIPALADKTGEIERDVSEALAVLIEYSGFR